jgi:multiple sugar transport system substrate-binding protein
MGKLRSLVQVMAGGLAVALAAAGCGGGGSPAAGGDPQRNADAEQVTLTISANAILGGKNTAEAEWITEYVIPTFTEAQAVEGVDVEVTFQPSGVDD